MPPIKTVRHTVATASSNRRKKKVPKILLPAIPLLEIFVRAKACTPCRPTGIPPYEQRNKTYLLPTQWTLAFPHVLCVYISCIGTYRRRARKPPWRRGRPYGKFASAARLLSLRPPTGKRHIRYLCLRR